MDWITTSGRTLDEAKSHALDQLGIVADEAEFDVVNDVEKGLFGRVKTEAKIRARVRPKQTATKDDRGRRRNGGGGGGRNRNQKGGGRGGSGKKGDSTRNDSGKRPAESGDRGGSNKQAQASGNGGSRNQNSRNGGEKKKPANTGNKQKPKAETSGSRNNDNNTPSDSQTRNRKPKKDIVEEHMSRQDQEAAAKSFLEGVLGAFEMTGAVAVVEEAADDDAIEMVVTGDELGLLVGQKGITLNALQELTRTVVQRRSDGAKTDRLRVDVAGYRARRTAALQAFATKIAEEVIDSGTEKLLEPMGPADRKVVHDALTDLDGVETGSEGEEPRRRVVIRPV